MMKYRLLFLALLVFGPISAAGQDVSGDFDVVCLVSDSVAIPNKIDETSSIEKTVDNDPCLHGMHEFHLGDHINILIQHAAGGTQDSGGEPSLNGLVLFLDGKSLNGTLGEPVRNQDGTKVSSNPDEDDEDVRWTVLQFALKRDLATDSARRNWKQVISGNKFGKEVAVSVGSPGGEPVPSDARIKLVVLTPFRAGLGIIAAALIGLIFFLILLKTGALRDKEPAGGNIHTPIDRAYSLSRVQAFLWTVLAVYAFIFVYWLTGEYNATIPGSVVTLMAISLGTLTTAAAVDSASSSTKQEKAQSLQSKLSPDYLEALQQRNELRRSQSQFTWSPGSEDADKAKTERYHERLEDLQQRIRTDSRNMPIHRQILALRRSSQVSRSAGFWADLFSNEGGAGLHRVQFGIWTLVLMVTFIHEVLQNVALPDFDTTLLALMGISSGAYAGLKIPEDKGDRNSTQTDATTDDDDDS